MEASVQTRRSILQLSAAVPVAALLGLPSGCASVADADEAWRSPGAGERDVRRWALAHAILAPNPHNKQPWLVQLDGESDILLRPDLSRLLPATDPFDRQIVIGCGAFLELLAMAAAERGYRADTIVWPEGEPQPRLDARPVARVRLVRDREVAAHPLFAQVLQRRTNRSTYDAERPVRSAELDQLREAQRPGVTLGSTAAPERVAALRRIVHRGYIVEADAPGPYRENVEAMRIGAREVLRYRDGISLSGPAIEAGRLTGLVSRAAFLKPDSFTRGEFRKSGDPWAETSMAFAWLATGGNSRAEQVEAGRAYLHLNLLATRAGFAMQPWSQCLQEYPEMRPTLDAVHRALGVEPPRRVQMLVRLGHADAVPPAPRRGLAAHLTA
jgi:hypothetical protein